MRDPVVASDGNSYEREAIEGVLQRGNRLSPLTREPLRPDVLIPNRNLRQRIEAFEGDLLDFATKAAETAVDRFAAALDASEVDNVSGEGVRRSKRAAEVASSSGSVGGGGGGGGGGAGGGRGGGKRSRHR